MEILENLIVVLVKGGVISYYIWNQKDEEDK